MGRAREPCVTDMGNESDCYIRFSYSISNVLCTYEVKQNKRNNKYTETCLLAFPSLSYKSKCPGALSRKMLLLDHDVIVQTLEIV